VLKDENNGESKSENATRLRCTGQAVPMWTNKALKSVTAVDFNNVL